MEQRLREEIADEIAHRQVISSAQIAALGLRLESLHAAKLLSEEELEFVEDFLADFIGLQASLRTVTMEVVYTNAVAGKTHQLIALSEQLSKDPLFARQLRRKIVAAQ
jgi:hypothetical protein